MITLWQSNKRPKGERCSDSLETFLRGPRFSNPPIEPIKDRLPGWSPALFRGDHRKKENVESVAGVVLDYDGEGVATSVDEAAALWGRFRGAIHTTHGHWRPPKNGDPNVPVARFRVVLVTDGEPTCGDDRNAMVELVAEWYRVGVETWVFGLPGSTSAVELLNALAVAGGTGQAQSFDVPEQLDDGFQEAAE